jgi:hypothetical protein
MRSFHRWNSNRRTSNRQTSNRRLAAAGTVAFATVAFGRPAGAALMLTLSEPGYAPVTFTDTTNSGGVSYFGTYGTFSTNFIVGESDKLDAGQTVGNLQVESLNVTNIANTGTSVLTVTVSDNNYAFPGGPGSADTLGSSFGGSLTSPNAGDVVTFQSSVLSPSTTTGLQSYTAPATISGTYAFASTATPVGFADPGTYSLTNVTTISLSGAGESANVSGSTTVTGPSAVPEPATATVGVFAGIAVLHRRRRGSLSAAKIAN